MTQAGICWLFCIIEFSLVMWSCPPNTSVYLHGRETFCMWLLWQTVHFFQLLKHPPECLHKCKNIPAKNMASILHNVLHFSIYKCDHRGELLYSYELCGKALVTKTPVNTLITYHNWVYQNVFRCTEAVLNTHFLSKWNFGVYLPALSGNFILISRTQYLSQPLFHPRKSL
jgi:hypothetical protein